MDSDLVCLCLFYLTTVVHIATSLLTTAKVSYPSVSWNDGFQTPGCQLLGHGFVNTKLEDIRVRGVTGGGSEYWIGAHVQYTKWIRLAGCYKTWIDSTSSDNDSRSVLDCYQRCEGTHFGLSVKGCVCDISTHKTADGCMATMCPGHINDICSTADVTSGFACLCTYEITNFPRDNEIGNCKLLATTVYGTTSVHSTDCGEEHEFVCKGSQPFYHYRKNWAEARLACIREEIGRYYKIFHTNWAYDNPGTYWESVFRKQISTWGDKTPQGTEFDCLAVSVSGEGKLNPSVRKCDTKLPLLCDQPQQKQAGGKVEIEKNKVEPKKCSVLLLLVGAAGGILFTIMVMIISMIIYRRRKKNTTSPQNGHQEVTPPETVEIQYEHLRTDDREGGNIYNVLGPSSDSYGYITVI